MRIRMSLVAVSLFVANRLSVTFLAILVLLPWAAAAQNARLTDGDLKKLIEEADHDRDRFEDALDGNFKDSIVRGARAEVSVKHYLDDLQENFKRLEERYSPEYAASEEALTVLRQGTDIGKFMKTQPDSMKGMSEWNRLATTLGTLGSAYGASFPVGQDTAARRINDKEAAKAAEKAADGADELKNAIGGDKAIPKDRRNALKNQAEALKEICETVKSRLNDGKPATAEARQMLDASKRMAESASAAGASQSTMSVLGPIRASMLTLQQAFGMSSGPAE